jgi:hypothetical protein
MYDWDGRKYLEVHDVDEKKTPTRLKVPWRYGRVMCPVSGPKTIQELKEGDKVRVALKSVMWNGLEHLVLEYIETGE